MKHTKSTIPLKDREEWSKDPFYQTCALYGQHGHECGGKITWEHAIINASKSVQAKWAVVPICEKGHAVNNYQDAGTMKKELNEWVAYSRATDEDIFALTGEFEDGPLRKCHRIFQRKACLVEKYGEYLHKVPEYPLFKTTTAKLDPQIDFEPGCIVPTKPEGPRKMWFEIKDDFKPIIQDAINHHKTVDNVHFTPYTMIEMMIATYEPSLGKKLVERKLEALETNNKIYE
jgi:hypothetical protein